MTAGDTRVRTARCYGYPRVYRSGSPNRARRRITRRQSPQSTTSALLAAALVAAAILVTSWALSSFSILYTAWTM